jgi:hypothetical protein
MFFTKGYEQSIKGNELIDDGRICVSQLIYWRYLTDVLNEAVFEEGKLGN